VSPYTRPLREPSAERKPRSAEKASTTPAISDRVLDFYI